jgi:hypothetical protein
VWAVRTLCTILLSLPSAYAASAEDIFPKPYQGPIWKTGRGYVSTGFVRAETPIGDGSTFYAGVKPGGGDVIAVLSYVLGPGILDAQIVPNEDIIVLGITPKRTGLPNWQGWLKYTVITERSPQAPMPSSVHIRMLKTKTLPLSGSPQ